MAAQCPVLQCWPPASTAARPSHCHSRTVPAHCQQSSRDRCRGRQPAAKPCARPPAVAANCRRNRGLRNVQVRAIRAHTDSRSLTRMMNRPSPRNHHRNVTSAPATWRDTQGMHATGSRSAVYRAARGMGVGHRDYAQPIQRSPLSTLSAKERGTSTNRSSEGGWTKSISRQAPGSAIPSDPCGVATGFTAAGHKRSKGPFGPVLRGSGAWFDCVEGA